MNVKISSSSASAAVTIAGVTPISTSMLASRTACQTIRAIASRPASQPMPSHMLTPASPIGPRSTSCQLKNETMRKAIAAPRTIFAPCESSLSLSILRTFPFGVGLLTSQS